MAVAQLQLLSGVCSLARVEAEKIPGVKLKMNSPALIFDTSSLQGSPRSATTGMPEAAK